MAPKGAKAPKADVVTRYVCVCVCVGVCTNVCVDVDDA